MVTISDTVSSFALLRLPKATLNCLIFSNTGMIGVILNKISRSRLHNSNLEFPKWINDSNEFKFSYNEYCARNSIANVSMFGKRQLTF